MLLNLWTCVVFLQVIDLHIVAPSYFVLNNCVVCRLWLYSLTNFKSFVDICYVVLRKLRSYRTLAGDIRPVHKLKKYSKVNRLKQCFGKLENRLVWTNSTFSREYSAEVLAYHTRRRVLMCSDDNLYTCGSILPRCLDFYFTSFMCRPVHILVVMCVRAVLPPFPCYSFSCDR